MKAELGKVGITLPSNTLCADSYLGIKEITNRKEEVRHSETEHMMDKEMDNEIAKIRNTPLEDIEYRELIKENLKTPRKSLKIANSIHACNVHKAFNPTLENIEITPNNRLTKLLEFCTKENPKSYSLINLHHHLECSLPTQSHGAEADCLTLLRTTSVLGMEWVQWVQDNSYLISNCQKMWSYTKL